jgi:L-ascorbate metabolism protein UlaG (beta-lactamase superfamily)
MTANLTVRAAGGPTAVLEVGGFRLVTDPTFDAPGEYVRDGAPSLTKTAPAAFGPDDIGAVDAVLLSHDQHPDNLDRSGRGYLSQVPVTITTSSGAERLAGAGRVGGSVSGSVNGVVTGLRPWEATTLTRPDRSEMVVTAVPARHGPEGCEPVTGEVTGFVLTGDGLPSIYVSGDNAWLGAVERVADRFGPVDVAVLFAGAASIPARLGGTLLTIDSAQAAEATRILGARAAIPVHFNSWSHFTEGADVLAKAFSHAGLADRLQLLAPGSQVTV